LRYAGCVAVYVTSAHEPERHVTPLISLEENILMTMSDIMRPSFAVFKPNARPLEVAHLLMGANQHGLPVFDQDEVLISIISAGDCDGLHGRQGRWGI